MGVDLHGPAEPSAQRTGGGWGGCLFHVAPCGAAGRREKSAPAPASEEGGKTSSGAGLNTETPRTHP